MDMTTVLLIIALVGGLYMAWNIGANDVANAMGTSVGSHALTIKQAVIVAAIFEFSGAFLVGGNVTSTIRKGIISVEIFQSPNQLALAMTAALLAAALWLQLASLKGLPVSTTHSIVGAVIGAGIVHAGLGAVQWMKIGTIIASWFISPVCGGILAFLVFTWIRKKILDSNNPEKNTHRLAPPLVLFAGTILMMTFIYKGLKNLKLDLSYGATTLLAAGVGLILAILARFWIKRTQSPGPDRDSQIKYVERVFAWLQIITACFMAFAHGSNDVANAIGPAAAVYAALTEGVVATKSTVPLWLLGLGGVGIVVGLATFGKRVIETVGKNITEVTPTRGFAAEFGAAATILLGSRLGLPLSTTHVLVGSVIGVGMARGISGLNLVVIRNIAASWIITLPAAAGVSALLFILLRSVLL
ncbi:MAG: hypothetical protein CMH56_01455 [Myxococcales bacterium]|nr:hypothetical protein [Myxococcales bacterium]